MSTGIAYIISNSPDRKHRKIFEDLCNKSISTVKQHCKLPTAVLSIGDTKRVNSDIIDGSNFLQPYIRENNGEEIHGLVAAELLKTHIHEWSPFDNTIYLDCDAYVMNGDVKHYVDVLSMGYELSLTTCVSMAWKDCIAETSVRKNIFGKIPSCFPYWNFGVFGSNKSSKKLLETIRCEFLQYCFKGWNKFGSCPHAQPAVVRAAFSLSPDHRIFTMPARYNAHFAAAGGYVFSGTPVVLHLWKDVRGLILKE